MVEANAKLCEEENNQRKGGYTKLKGNRAYKFQCASLTKRRSKMRSFPYSLPSRIIEFDREILQKITTKIKRIQVGELCDDMKELKPTYVVEYEMFKHKGS